MTDHEIDQALRHQREIEPPPFFARRVMALLRAEAQFAPLPFPRKRIAAASVLLLVAIAAALEAPELTMPAGTAMALAAAALLIALAATSGVRWQRHRSERRRALPPHSGRNR